MRFVLKKYKNKILEVIHEEGFDVEQFKKHEKNVDGSQAAIFQLVNSPLFFMIRTNPDDYHSYDCRYINFSPDFSRSEYEPDRDWGDFEFCYDKFIWWLNNHVKEYQVEMEVPDLWSELQGKPLFETDPLVDRNADQFNRIEKDKIERALLQFKSMLIEEYKPTEEQLNSIEDRLKYLSDSTERLNKVDWQGVAISTIMSISIALSLDTAKGKHLFDLFKRSFQLAIEFMSN